MLDKIIWLSLDGMACLTPKYFGRCSGSIRKNFLVVIDLKIGKATFFAMTAPSIKDKTKSAVIWGVLGRARQSF